MPARLRLRDKYIGKARRGHHSSRFVLLDRNYRGRRNHIYQNKIAIISKSLGDFVPLQNKLNENGMEAYVASAMEDFFEKYIRLPFVLAIVDAISYREEMPELVRHLRGAKTSPILVLMTESCPYSRLDLLRMGATVCINAEADPEERAAQVRALIQIYGARDDNLHRETLVFGTALVINPIYHLVIQNGERIDLPRREFDLLYFMAKHEMQVFTQEQLYRQLWSDDDDTQIGDTVKSAIKVLRKKLEPAGHEFIQNEWGTGYRFVGNAGNL